jgi:hypothetical protein
MIHVGCCAFLLVAAVAGMVSAAPDGPGVWRPESNEDAW